MKRRNRVVVATVLSCLIWAGLAGRREVFALLPVAPVEGCLTCPAGFKTGVPDTNRRDDKGRRQGLWVEMGRKGSLSYRGHFKDDMPEGRFVYTRGDTLVAEAFYFRGGYASYNRFFYPDSQLMAQGYYLDKQKDSVWEFYARDGRLLRREHYEKGLKNGVLEVFDSLGKILVHQEWFRGLRNGYWMEWNAAGFQSYTYKLNLSHGPYAAFYADSVRAIEGQYAEGLKQGKWSFYLPSGTLYQEDFYQDDLLMDRVFYLSVQGELRPVSMDTIALVMLSPQGGRAEVLTDAGGRLLCDESFAVVCGILDMEAYFYANPNAFVAFRVLDKERLPDLLGDWRGEERMLYDGQLEPSMQLGQNASVRPVELPLRVKTPFPVYLDANGMEMLENTFSGREMPEAEE